MALNYTLINIGFSTALTGLNVRKQWLKTPHLWLNLSAILKEDLVIKNVAAKDITVPTAESIKVTGPRTIQVTFSEPLDENVIASDTVNSFSLDKGTIALDTTQASYNGRVLTLNTLADLSEGNHTLELKANSSLKDSAGLIAQPASLSFNFVKDTSVPTAQVVKSTEKTVTIKFSKAVDPSTLVNNANVEVTHTYNTATNKVTGAAITNPSGDGQTFVITFGNPLPPGSTTVYFNYADDNAQLVEDYYGNEFAETTFTVSTVADIVKPTVEKVEFVDATTLKVYFSENVDAGTALDETNYVLKDSAGDKIAVTGAAFDGDSTSVVKLTTDTINGGNLTLTVEDVKDNSVAANEMNDQTVSFTATDKVAPTVSSAKQISDKKVKVTFSEAMDASYTTDKDNWTSALAEIDKIEAADNNKAVIITFKASLDTTDAGGDDVLDNENLTLARVKDAAGNWIEAFSTPVAIDVLAELTPDAVKMTSKNTVKLTFEDEVVSGAVAGDFEVSYTGDFLDDVKVTGVSTSVVDGDTIITLTLDKKVANTIGTGVVVQTAGGTSTAGAKNQYGNTLSFIGENVADAIAPELSSAEIADADGSANGLYDQVTLTFSEALYAYSVQDTDFTVEGYTVTGIDSVVGSTVVLKLKENNDNNSTPVVTLVGEVEDSSRNVLKGNAKVEATVAP